MSICLPTVYQNYIHQSRYARFRDDVKRRESWSETVERYITFFKKKFPTQEIPWDDLYDAILNLQVVPSMRALMSAGPALEKDNIAGYNCSYLPIDSVKAFDEVMYILMCGTGVGFSVESRYVKKLPDVPEELHPTDTTIIFHDSKLGWAKGFREFLSLLWSGLVPRWDVSNLRPAGSRLKTFGGRASGPEPLVDLMEFTIRIFKGAGGRKLTTLECHDLVCKVADIVVSGGVRRSALISLSDLNDDHLRHAKSGKWEMENGQRFLANNSAVYETKPPMSIFLDEFVALYKSRSGERGIFSRKASQLQAAKYERRSADVEYGTNPCSEIILQPNQFCNLTEAILRKDENIATLMRKVELATILGTLQSTLTNFRYISKKWKTITESERLLGVSLTGICDNQFMSTPSDGLAKTLTQLRLHAVETNKKFAAILGIDPSAAITCVKPSGCAIPSTPIKTNKGVMTLEQIFQYQGYDLENFEANTWLSPTKDLRVYDENNELQPITKLYVNGVSEVYELEDDLGNKFSFTGNHKVKLVSGEWVEVQSLKPEDDIECINNCIKPSITVTPNETSIRMAEDI